MSNGNWLIDGSHPWENHSISLFCRGCDKKVLPNYFCYFCNMASCDKHCKNFGFGKPKVCNDCLIKQHEIQILFRQEFNKYIQDNCGHYEIQDRVCVDCHKEL